MFIAFDELDRHDREIKQFSKIFSTIVRFDMEKIKYEW